MPGEKVVEKLSKNYEKIVVWYFLLWKYFLRKDVPDHFKIAEVIPVYKKGSPLVVTNYRPISLLSIFNKILERLMYNRLIKYFEKSSTIFYQQFGICSSHSTGHALLLLIDKIQKAIDSKTCSCGIFRDWCKAFDSGDHHVLLDKLEYYGISGQNSLGHLCNCINFLRF